MASETNTRNDAVPDQRPSADITSLLAAILAHHEELGLDDQQFSLISRIYWDRSNRPNSIDVITTVASTLSSDQFCKAVALFVPQAGSSSNASPLNAELKRLVTEALETQSKDKQLVEVELAAKVAERVMGWTKLFAFFLAAPAALGLILLSLFGFSKFEDVQKASSTVSAKVVEAQTKVDTSLQKIDEVSQNVARTEQQLSSIQNRLTEQLNEELQKGSAALQARIADVQSKVDEQLEMVSQNFAKAGQQLSALQTSIEDQRKKFAVLDTTVTNLAESRRLALVFGNNAYKGEPLYNAVNNANDIAEVLKNLNFMVTLHTNGTSESMRDELQRFRDRVRGADIALLYFAGHSSVIKGVTWLIPVNSSKDDVETTAINLDEVVKSVTDATRVGLVFIDACRASETFSGGCGPPPNVVSSMVVSYPTSPGDTLPLSVSKSNFYAKALEKYMIVRGLDLTGMLHEVMLDVYQRSNGRQRPWFLESVLQKVYLLPPQAAGEASNQSKENSP